MNPLLMWILISLALMVLLVLLSIRLFKRWRIKKIDIRMEGLETYIDSLKSWKPEGKLPNIIIILTDDMGYEDISCFGASAIKTPNIDKIAEEGVIFTNFYSSSPICSPSRAGLLTGRYPIRAHVPTVFIPSASRLSFLASLFLYSYGMDGMAMDEITLGEILQAIGYKTALIGKWHLGDQEPFLPNNKGFDFFYGAHYSNDMDPYEIYRNKEVDLPAPVNQDLLTNHLTKEAIDFIKKSKEEPFFLYYAQPFPHAPLHASDEFKNMSEAGIYGDCVQEVDGSIGQILEFLEESNQIENTLIIFTSDNGPWHQGNPGYARGRKGLNYEGGQRVPFIARWPGKFPAGMKTNVPSMNIDLLPTILNLIGVPLPKDRIIDGCSIENYLTDPNIEKPLSRPLFYFWNKNIKALREDNWKYHVKHRSDVSTYVYMKYAPTLYDLEKDPNESYDQTLHHPHTPEEMAEKIIAFEKELKENLRGWKK